MNAVHNIHTHLNLNGNEVRNVRLEGLPSDPGPVEGGVYFNLETGEFRFSDGTAWKSLLRGFWKLDDDGNLVTDKTVIVPNLIVRGDLSTEAKGSDAGAAGGIIGVKVGDAEYTDISDGILDMTEAFEGLDVDVDLSDYYTNEETDAKIAESLIPYAKIADVGSTYATKASLETLQGEVNNIEAILGMDEEAEGIINTWNEVKAFLDGYSSSDDLAAILSTMNADIAKRALDSDLDTLAGRVGVNELAIADNAGNIKKNFDAIGVLESNKADKATTLAGYGITDAYTKVNVDDLLKKYLLLEAESQTIKGNIRIEGNLIIAGDMSSEGTGGNSGADGTVIGVVVNGTQYTDETNGMLDLSTLMNQYALATAIPTTLPASDVYPWAKKSSLALIDIPDLSSRYLSAAGGTITGAYSPLAIQRQGDALGVAIEYKSTVRSFGYIGAGIRDGVTFPFFDNGTTYTIIHSGNIGSQSVASANLLTKHGGTSTTASSWNPKTAWTKVWGQSFADSNISSDTGDMVYYVRPSEYASGQTELCCIIDGDFYAGAGGTGPYKVWHAGNFKPADYLPLSGGTITRSDRKQLLLKNSNASGLSALWIGGEFENFTHGAQILYNGELGSISIANFASYKNSSKGLGAFRITKDNKIQVGDVNFSDGYVHDLIHSGNIGSYAPQYSTNILLSSSSNLVGYTFETGGDTKFPEAGPAMVIGSANGAYKMAFHSRRGVLRFNSMENGTLTGWKIIASTDSTVAAANKLVSGTTDVLTVDASKNAFFEGVIYGKTQPIVFKNGDDNVAYFGSAHSTISSTSDGAGIMARGTRNIYFSTNANVRMLINSSGNVTIGASDLAGTSYKFAVNGNASINISEQNPTSAAELTRTNTFSIQCGIDNRFGLHSWLMPNGSACIQSCYAEQYQNRTYPLILNPFGSSVLVGTTTDSGYKLDVNGTARISGAVTMSSTLSVTKAITKPNTASATMPDNYISAGGGFSKNTGKYGVKILCCDQADTQTGLGQDLSTVGVSNGYDLSIVGGNSAQDKGSISFVTHKANSTTYRTLGYFKDDAGAVTFNINGDLIMAGDLSSTSDMRLKHRIDDVVFDLKTIAEMPLFTFRWKDGRDGRLHLGSSAQYWEKPAPWLVIEDSSKTLNYAVLGVAGMKSLAVTAVDHETRIKMLERKVDELETENRRLRYGN